MSPARPVILLLGYAGLIPFVAAALAAVIDSGYADAAHNLAAVYAFGIISFLCGSWWGLALAPGARKALVFSNLLFLLALFIFVFAAPWWPLMAALLLMIQLFAEQNGSLFPAFQPGYRRMRQVLSGVAAASMLTLHLLA